jgi:hypothetical protein
LNTAITVTATQKASTAPSTSYSVSVANTYGDGVTGWAVFDGTTNVANGSGAGTFTVANGKSYKVYGVAGAGGKGVNYTTISPTAPDTTPPVVAVSSPSDSSVVSGLVPITATASDVGSGIAHVEFRADGVLIGSDTAAPYTTLWDAATVSLGAHTIEVTAVDKAALSSSAAVQVQVAAASVKTGTSITMTCPSTVKYGATARVRGSIMGTSAVEGAPVTIQISSDGTSWSNHRSAVTRADGSFEATTAALTVKRYFRAVYAGSEVFSSCMTTRRAINPNVYFSKAPALATYTLKFGTVYSVWGYYKPKHATGSTQIKLLAYRWERRTDGTLGYVLKRTVTTTTTNPAGSAYSRYKVSLRLPYRGTWRIRAYHAADALNAATYSAYRSMTVK